VAGVEVRREVAPRWPFRLSRRAGMDGVLRVRGGVLHRLLHVEGEPVVVRVAQPSAGRVVLGARAERADAAEEGLARMRFALGVDDDLRPFHERFRHDPLIGAAVRAHPTLRARRRPEPFEALAWAVTEQLIEYERAAAIQRRLVGALGRRCPRTGLRDVPTAAAVAGLSPARLCGWDLAEARALALLRAAREVAAGRVPLRGDGVERGWRRLRAIRGIGSWTVEILAVQGQGRYDQLPAGDLAYRKWVGRHLTGRPRAVASEDEVRRVFAPYEGWAGLAAAFALHSGGERVLGPY
jgi:3-methyladenine DNA glycosylase/8-oxoguanine DNA glycosylase